MTTSSPPHPLQFTWCFWEQQPQLPKSGNSEAEWKNLQRHICSFNTVEEFWFYHRGLPPPSQVFLDPKTREKRLVGKEGEERVIDSFSLFKKDIEPSWEDDANIRGGEWWMRKSFSNLEVLDRWWDNLVLALVGCTIENGDDICGARVVDKSKPDGRFFVKIELWLRTKDATIRNQLLENMCREMVDGDQLQASDLKREFMWKGH